MHLLILIFGNFFFNLCYGSDFNPDYPNVKICVVSEAHGGHESPMAAYNYLKTIIGLGKRCTHIYGNLHIHDLGPFDNGTEPDLGFLESIQEISGCLSIFGNYIKRIPLTNLKVIRGVSIRKETEALKIYNNHNITKYLEEIDLRNLRVIMKKNVTISRNPGLPFIEHQLDWNQILDDPSTQTVRIHRSSNNTVNCHNDCEYWTSPNNNSSQFCFGPSKQECQIQTKCVINKDSKWCKFTNTVETPCNHECAGGCYGKTPEQCAVCATLLKNATCTSSCARTSHIFGINSNDKLKYTVAGLCTSQCPDSLLDQNKICVYECDFDSHRKYENKCIECVKDVCDLTKDTICDLSKIDKNYPKNNRKYTLNKKTLVQLTNCTTILGELDIDDASFSKYEVTIPLLHEHLKNVREIFGQFALTFLTTKVYNASFLQNLKEIRTSVKSPTVSPPLKIYGSHLKFLGLKQLRKVYGKIAINGKNETCFLNKIPWHELSADFNIKTSCNQSCHPLCTRGCWGPDNDMCYDCEFNNAGNRCVRQCSDVPGYFKYKINSNKTECQTCHPLCKQNCTGPTAKDCNNNCLFAMESNTCVKQCSLGFYPLANTTTQSILCLPCHKMCQVDNNLIGGSYTCSGPLNILGFGGCSKCEKLINIGNNKYQCHKGSCPIGYFLSVNKDIQQLNCEQCHSLCTSCNGSSDYRHDCRECKGLFYNDRCVFSCPNEVMNVTKPSPVGGNCSQCHQECRNGCRYPNDKTSCNRCKHYKLSINADKNEFMCVTHCPHDRNYTEYKHGENLCLTFEETIYSKQKRVTTIIVIGGLILILAIIIGFVLCYRWRSNQTKIKAELKALYSNYKEPNTKNSKDDNNTRPPNMNRLHMIPISDLIFDVNSKPLGSGAFGKVFRGYWKVPGKDKIYKLDVVIKVIHNASKGSIDEFLDEAKIMASVRHRHCLPLIGVCLSLDKPCLISTYAVNGSLDKYLHQNSQKIASTSMLKWSEQIADGMAYLNKRGIIHRDLAARNVLINDKDLIQITDFGLARIVDETEDSIIIKSGKVPIRWLALETLLNATYSQASDVWAYGVTLWEIFTYGKRPYEELETGEIKLYLQQGNRLCQPEISTLEVYMVMIKCWLDDPHMRPSFIELMTIFEQFLITPKRFLFLPHEHINQKYPKSEDQKEFIQLNQISIDSDFRPTSMKKNKSDEMSFGAALNNDSAYHLISNSFSKEDNSILPKRKKAKRNISLDRLKNFSKFELNKITSRLHRDSKTSTYQTSSVYDSSKTTSTSIDSATPFFSERSNEYDSQPVNPQIAKIKKEIKHNNHFFDGNSRIENIYKSPDRIFVDQNLKEETECLLQNPASRSPSLPPIDIPHVFPRINTQIEPTLNSIEKLNENSPDSGNSHNFDIDDYLVPSRISSAGYYNLTPSPSTNIKHSMNLNDTALLTVHNEDYIDDGYLEPKKINR